jgi:hypothetical protein
MCASAVNAQPCVIAGFTFVSDAGDTMSVHAGIAPGASPGIDVAMGEMEIPPPPPTGVFDVRLLDPDTLRRALGEGAWLDVRDGDPAATATTHHLLLCRAGAAMRGTVHWNLPSNVVAVLTVHDAAAPCSIIATGTGSAPVEAALPCAVIQIAMHYNSRLLTIRVLLEGAFDVRTNLMRTSLLDRGVLGGHFAGAQIPARAVDSIGIELRDSIGDASSVQRITRPAWVLADGTVCPFVSPFDSPLLVPDPLNRAMYLAIHHRNHLTAVCAEPIPAGIPAAERDFTSGPAMYAGGNAALLAPGIWGLIAGDANGDNRIGIRDHSTIRAGIGKNRTYDPQDVNLNGGIGAVDLALVRRAIGSPLKEP